ncbi:hypothetical protein [Bradyrhizobium sp. B117]|uniref:hypothetical protein n=1 Tax=Bradyrhizobium sp. B117 TaxID=3140246 RepID=UPI00318431E4
MAPANLIDRFGMHRLGLDPGRAAVLEVIEPASEDHGFEQLRLAAKQIDSIGELDCVTRRARGAIILLSTVQSKTARRMQRDRAGSKRGGVIGKTASFQATAFTKRPALHSS